MTRYIIGIDEVGRGPLAGPVTVAVVALSMSWTSPILRTGDVSILKDSKKLTAKQREVWFRCIASKSQLKTKRIFYTIASVYPKTIDRINISQAANLAATRALARVMELMSYGRRSRVDEVRVYLDGGLYLRDDPHLDSRIPASTIIRGDEKYNCIKLASIIAKVRRDRLMKRYHKKFPQYGFHVHKGYGTKAHMAAIKKHGICQIHRLTFIKNLLE